MSSEKKEFVMSAKNILQTEISMPSILVESSGDFVLPDYMPKVQKVLRLDARATPPSKYVGAKDAQMSGDVLHTLVYLGEDGEIGATVLPSKYEFSIPLENISVPQLISAAVDVDTINYRLGGPRKLNIRTRLRAKPHVFGGIDITAEQNPEESDNIYKLYGEIDSVNTVLLNMNEVTVSDSIPISGGENSHLIWCGTSAAVSDVKVIDGGVSVRGEVVTKLIMDDGGAPKFFSKKTPFEEFLEGDVRRGAVAYCYANAVSTEASKQNDNEALVDTVVSIEALVDTPCKIPVLKDVFSDLGEGKTEYREFEAQSLATSRSGIYNVGANVNAQGISAVLDTSGSAILDEISANGTKLTAAGRCMLNSICLTGENSISSNEFTVPFKIVIDGEYTDEMTAFGNASLVSARARVDGESITFDMDIALCTRAKKSDKISAVEKYDFTSAKPYNDEEYPLCLIYSSGESLWSLAKKYHVSPKSLAKVNSLDIDEADMQNPEKLASHRALMLEFK